MTLTEHETLNTTAAAFDVQLRYFSGPPWALLIAGGLDQLASWTDPDTGRPATWTEITDRTAYAGQFAQRQQGASIVWQADLSGWLYDEALLGLGRTLLCWRRVYRPTGTGTAPAGWQNWQRAFVGEIVTRNDRQDYTAGRYWKRTVVGYDNWLSHYNAPRITAGKIRITDGASATGSAALAQAAQEADKGEFVGGTASVALTNVIDGNRNTVYISDDIPTQTLKAWPPLKNDAAVACSEIFFRPVAGWSQARTWWVELYNQRSQNDRAWGQLIIGKYVSGAYTFSGPVGIELTKGACGLIVANRAAFDEYSGASNNGAEKIIDWSQYQSSGALTDDGLVYCGGFAFAWAPGGASRTYVYQGQTIWNGATFNSTSVATGQSLVNNYDGVWIGPNAPNGTWSINANPHPGANNNGDGPVWLKVLLPENVCLTLAEVSAASTTIRLDNYRAWLAPTTGVAQGVIAGCLFSWTSRDADGLHGVTWVSAPNAALPVGTAAAPYVNDYVMTGYPLTATHLIRRKLPTIAHYKVFWSAHIAADYGAAGWAFDYYPVPHEQQGNTQNLHLTDVCNDGTTPYLWVRTILYLVYAMTDGGRVKVNEIAADLAQVALDLAGTPALDGQDVYVLAYYLWESWCRLPTIDFYVTMSAGAHKMGNHALAITPVARVFDDLARATGALVWYQPTGGVRWLDDPWWPKNSVAPESLYVFGSGSIRDSFALDWQQVGVDYVVLNALSLEGDPHTVRYVYPQPLNGGEPPIWAQVTEISDRVIARDSDAPAVAQMEAEKLVAQGRSLQLTVKGVGEWCRPGQVVSTSFDTDGDGYLDTLLWLIEQTTTQYDEDTDGRQLTTTLTLRGFRS